VLNNNGINDCSVISGCTDGQSDGDNCSVWWAEWQFHATFKQSIQSRYVKLPRVQCDTTTAHGQKLFLRQKASLQQNPH